MTDAQKLKLETFVTTCGFYSDSPQYPNTDYGESIPVMIENHHEDGIPASTTIRIGSYMFTMESLEQLLAQAKTFTDVNALFLKKQYYKDDEDEKCKA